MSGDQYDTGFNPSVAMDSFNLYSSTVGTTVVEVHQAGLGMSDLWYHVGTIM
jgi:hypothetical protein